MTVNTPLHDLYDFKQACHGGGVQGQGQSGKATASTGGQAWSLGCAGSILDFRT